MANLTDMEELLHKIENTQIRDYMHEALMCYMTKAYRGCIVLCFISLFDDITAKLEKLGTVNSTAREIFNQIKLKKEDQEVYENYLIEQLKSKKLLPEIDAEFAGILRQLRNKSAHPSGHKPSAEEARYVFFEVIDRFLSKPIFSTTHLVEEIINRLENDNFFVDMEIDKICEVVKDEISALHKDAFPLLISQLINNHKSNKSTLSNNINHFICGLAELNNGDINNSLEKIIVKKKCDDPKFNNMILEIISTQPTIFKNLNSTQTNRVLKIISEAISHSNLSLEQNTVRHPANVLLSLSTIYSDSEFNETFKDSLNLLFNKAPSLKKLSKIFKDKPKVFDSYLTIIKSKAGSNQFDTANEYCKNITSIESVYIKHINDKQSFEIITAISKSAKNGAFRAESIVDNEFNSISATKEKAMDYIESNKEDAETYFEKEIYRDIPSFLY